MLYDFVRSKQSLLSLQALLWLLNAAIIALVLARILIYGEPVTPSSSEESGKYFRHIQQADEDIKAGIEINIVYSFFLINLYVSVQ